MDLDKVKKLLYWKFPECNLDEETINGPGCIDTHIFITIKGSDFWDYFYQVTDCSEVAGKIYSSNDNSDFQVLYDIKELEWQYELESLLNGT